MVGNDVAVTLDRLVQLLLTLEHGYTSHKF
jgi:hypothetical protein